jgi:hypothetical protein
MDDCCNANENNFPRLITRHIVVSLLSILVLPVFVANSQTDQAHFDIPAGTSEDSILQFAEQAHVLVSYGNNIDDIPTHAVAGELEIDRALNRMLEGTPNRRRISRNLWISDERLNA